MLHTSKLGHAVNISLFLLLLFCSCSGSSYVPDDSYSAGEQREEFQRARAEEESRKMEIALRAEREILGTGRDQQMYEATRRTQEETSKVEVVSLRIEEQHTTQQRDEEELNSRQQRFEREQREPERPMQSDSDSALALEGERGDYEYMDTEANPEELLANKLANPNLALDTQRRTNHPNHSKASGPAASSDTTSHRGEMSNLTQSSASERPLASLGTRNEHCSSEEQVDMDNLSTTLHTAEEQHTTQQRDEEELNSRQQRFEREQREPERPMQSDSDSALALEGERGDYEYMGTEANPEELLANKLANPNLALDTQQSISLIEHCAWLGAQNADEATNKEAVAILGETGAGKSTFINYWTGCRMALSTPEELAAMGVQAETWLDDVVIVSPDSNQEEVASIGHTRTSHTFMPLVVPDPNCDARVYLDCPGFADNRGPIINIVNAMNTGRILQQAQGVKAVFIVKYGDLVNLRGVSSQIFGSTCERLFGGIDNLMNHQNSFLLGIGGAPVKTSLARARALCESSGSPITRVLAHRIFLYDPLERGGQEFWSREQFLREIEEMPHIPREIASSMFQPPLTDMDKQALQCIVIDQEDTLTSAFEQRDYSAASRCWDFLKNLRVIGNREATELVEGQIMAHMLRHVSDCAALFNEYSLQHNFTEAENLFSSLCSLNEYFPEEQLVDLDRLREALNTARTKYTAQLRAEEKQRRAEEEQRRAEEEQRRAEEGRRRAEEGRRRAEEEQRRSREELQEEQRRNRELTEKLQRVKEESRRMEIVLRAEREILGTGRDQQ